jgi:hypothetical protein
MVMDAIQLSGTFGFLMGMLLIGVLWQAWSFFVTTRQKNVHEQTVLMQLNSLVNSMEQLKKQLKMR